MPRRVRPHTAIRTQKESPTWMSVPYVGHHSQDAARAGQDTDQGGPKSPVKGGFLNTRVYSED